jgi:hypothetical protein
MDFNMDFKSLGKNLSDFGAQITPFASRTFQYTKEQLGQTDDKVVCHTLPIFLLLSCLLLHAGPNFGSI